MKILLVGPVALAGIGQVMLKYQRILVERGHQVTYINYFEKGPDHDVSFIFIIPIDAVLDIFHKLKNATVMTVCETDTVHKSYSLLPTDRTIFVPSIFCQEVLQNQFKTHKFSVLRHWTDPNPQKSQVKVIEDAYVFYTIGNVKDPRKNLRLLLEAFVRLNLPRAHLLIKSSCTSNLILDIPNVTVINEGLVSDTFMEEIHSTGDCYVNCSHSEGVGMGTVEAAVHDKPIILSEYGGAKEYVDTPFIIECDKGLVGYNDFLFEPNMSWGHPRLESLMAHMKHCYENDICTWDHTHTKQLLGSLPPIVEYIVCNPVHQGRYNKS
jgi:glycosyltransferase involved in cell wall biosynthesis